MDPLTQSYPWYTPYQFAGNKPTIAVDLDGLEEKLANELHGYQLPMFGDLFTDPNKPVTDPGKPFRVMGAYGNALWKSLRSIFIRDRPLGSHGSEIEPEEAPDIPKAIDKAVEDVKTLKNGTAEEKAEVAGRWTVGLLTAAAAKGVKNASSKGKSSPTKTVSSNAPKKPDGRILIVDENLSSELVTALKEKGYKVKTFDKGTKDVDIITYAERNNAIIITNNIADFNPEWGITTFKVSERMKRRSEVNNVVKAIENVSEKAKANSDVIASGKNISLAENQ